MAHELDITDGRASFITAREDAWHRLGTTVSSSFTAEEAMETGLLGGWNVRKRPLLATLDDGGTIPITDRYGVVRDNPVSGAVDSLGVVGPDYVPIQNEEHAEILNALVDESGANFETAGAIRGGRQVFVTMKLPGHIKIGGVDEVENYLAAINSHDGSKSFTIMVTPVRIVCANTLNAAYRGKKASFSMRHTRNVRRNCLTMAREALELSFKYLDGFQETADRLINTTLTQTRFEEIISAEFGPTSSSATAVTRATNRIDKMAELFSDSFTHEGVRQTAWAGYNALVEYSDHFSQVNGTDKENGLAVKSLFDSGSFKNRALELFMAEAAR